MPYQILTTRVGRPRGVVVNLGAITTAGAWFESRLGGDDSLETRGAFG